MEPSPSRIRFCKMTTNGSTTNYISLLRKYSSFKKSSSSKFTPASRNEVIDPSTSNQQAKSQVKVEKSGFKLKSCLRYRNEASTSKKSCPKKVTFDIPLNLEGLVESPRDAPTRKNSFLVLNYAFEDEDEDSGVDYRGRRPGCVRALASVTSWFSNMGQRLRRMTKIKSTRRPSIEVMSAVSTVDLLVTPPGSVDLSGDGLANGQESYFDRLFPGVAQGIVRELYDNYQVFLRAERMSVFSRLDLNGGIDMSEDEAGDFDTPAAKWDPTPILRKYIKNQNQINAILDNYQVISDEQN